MQVLIIGGGGREHALAWKCARSPLVDRVYVAPGNAGTAQAEGMENVAIAADDIHGLADFAERQAIGLTVVGPELPLVMGVVDEFKRRRLPCFGPTAEAAKLEGSKTFTKEFLQRHAIPTAAYQAFSAPEPALEFAVSLGFPVVIKADGLAAGKGVVIAADATQAAAALHNMLTDGGFGEAGRTVVVEQYLRGEEVSFIGIVSGQQYLAMATSQDHKAAYNGDRGPNTGGMGACSPAPIVDDALQHKILTTVFEPTLMGLANDGIDYMGFLYAGLMVGEDGVVRVLEFNCRFGDPETQPIMLRMESDLVAHCLAAINGNLEREQARWRDDCAVGVVLAAAGYPGPYTRGHPISGIRAVQEPSVIVFHSGTAIEGGDIVSAGGRVLCVTARGQTMRIARERAYAATELIHWDGCWKRDDIGSRGQRAEGRGQRAED